MQLQAYATPLSYLDGLESSVSPADAAAQEEAAPTGVATPPGVLAAAILVAIKLVSSPRRTDGRRRPGRPPASERVASPAAAMKPSEIELRLGLPSSLAERLRRIGLETVEALQQKDPTAIAFWVGVPEATVQAWQRGETNPTPPGTEPGPPPEGDHEAIVTWQDLVDAPDPHRPNGNGIRRATTG